MSEPRKVAQYTLEGEFIRTFESVAEAERFLGYKPCSGSTIWRCCKLKQAFSYGYRWLYVEDMPQAKKIFEENQVKYLRLSFQEVKQAVKKCGVKTKGELFKTNRNLYNTARYHGWIDKLGLEKAANPYKDNIYTVYVIPFYETNTVYVGLTDNLKRRWQQHNDSTLKYLSAPLKYSLKTGIPMPDYPLIIEENLYALEALYYEDFWRRWYKGQGMTVLNKAKTGVNSGGLGSLQDRINNKDIFKAAKSCKTLKEFEIKHKTLYNIAHKRGITDALGLKRAIAKHGTYTEKYCYDIAVKCKSAEELKKVDLSAYSTAAKNNWLKQYWWFFHRCFKPIVETNKFKIKIYSSAKSCCESKHMACETLRACTAAKLKHKGSYYHYLDISDIEFDIPDFEHRYII